MSGQPQGVRIKAVREDPEAPGGRVYELEPIGYEGPWKLEPQTVLEVKGQIGGEK